MHLPTIFLVKFIIPFHKGVGWFLLICLQSMYAVKDDRFCFKDNKCILQRQNYSIKWLLDLKTINREWFGLLSIISLELSLCVTLSIKKMGFRWWVQRVKKVVSYSPGLLDFAIGLVNSVVNLPDGQVKFFEEFELQKNFEINLLIKTFLGLVEMMFGLSKC